MKKMIIMRGPQGVGKSSLAKSLGLEGHTLSSDSIRLLLGGAELTAWGEWGISQDRGDAVWGTFSRMARERMERGETLALDAMFMKAADSKEFLEWADELGYETLFADFSAVPMEVAVARDAERDELRRVGARAIKATYEGFKVSGFSVKQSPKVKVAAWTPELGWDGLASAAKAWLEVPENDYSAYDEVVHLGDLQGCSTVAFGPGGLLEKGFDPNKMYLFAGDLVDRGLENGVLMRKMVDQATGLPNVRIVWGNHEDHLENYAKGKEAKSREFRLRTEPQLREAGVAPDEVAALLAQAREIELYNWRGVRAVVTHAGLPGIPPIRDGKILWHLVSSRQLNKGAGSYSDPIDEAWNRAMEKVDPSLRRIQIHGHRNHGSAPIRVGEWSFNLEDRVEFGGSLRGAILSEKGWTEVSTRNHVFASWRERFGSKRGAKARLEGKEKGDKMNENADLNGSDEDASDDFAFDVRLPIPEWIKDGSEGGCKLDEKVLQAMREHPGVMEKSMASHPSVRSLNFTRDVFFDKSWDEVVVKARGLFVDAESGEVVARGYDKFFNVGERPETEMGALAKSLKFPIVGFVKENGYLGNVGYDAAADSLFVASKSTSEGDFAAWFKEIFESQVPEQTRDEMRRYLRDAEASLVFEVIDPKRDPHMIEYDAPKLVLLDAFHRSGDGRKMDYKDLKKIAGNFGLEVKRRAFAFKDFDSFAGWMARSSMDLSYKFSGENVEGMVIEDSAGFQTKVKLPYYGFWKSMRSSKDRILRLRTKIEELQAQESRKAGKALAARTENEASEEAKAELEDFCAWREAKLAGGGLSESASVGELKAAYGSEMGKAVPEAFLALRKESPLLAKAKDDLRRATESDDHPLAKDFLAWAAVQPLESLASDIIELRKRFDEQVGISEEHLKTRWTRFDPSEKEPVRAPKEPKAEAAEAAKARPPKM